MKLQAQVDQDDFGSNETAKSPMTRRALLAGGVKALSAAGLTVVAPGLSLAAETSASTGTAKVIFVLFRRSDLTHEQCLAEWNGDMHTSIVRKVSGLRKWVQNHVAVLPNEMTPDGLGELWFDSPDVMAEAMKSAEMGAAVEDAKRFLDFSRTYAIIVDEKSVIS